MDTPASAPAAATQPSKVDFAWSFGTPHRLTAALPDSGRKTLLDLQAGWLKLSWTYEDLTTYPLAAFLTPATRWEIHVEPQVDGARFAKSTWRRAEGWLPVLDNRYSDDRGEMTLQAAGGESAMIVRVEVRNTSPQEHTYSLRSTCPGGWAGYNPSWVDPAWSRDVLLAGWKDRADRVLALAVGGEMERHKTAISQTWRLKPGQTQVAWLVRPYEAYEADLPALRKKDWGGQFEAGKRTWRDLLARTMRVEIPDEGVRNAFLACLADLFVMREPVAGGYVAATPGTEVYRQSSPVEAGIVAIAIDQVGLHAESAEGFRMCLELQGDDGNWNDPKGWGHLMWCCAGFKAWAAIEHYRLTGDQKYLEAVYPRMLASSRWQETQRARMRVMDKGVKPATYGLMPRGMGDAGLMDGDDHYGIFLPHNIWAVYADQVTLEAAGILGKAADLPELTRIYQTGKADLLEALHRGAIQETGYRWIPAVSGKTCGSRWGALNAAFPCRLLPADHELITGTIRKMESRMSPGGIPVHTGWMVEGMWVAITLDNLAEVLLQRGGGDEVAKYILATLNHGTPLYTWCEERAQPAGTTECSGDRQHLWTPVAVVRMIRDALLVEEGQSLHLAGGVDRQWLTAGVGVENAPTHFGPVSYRLHYDPAAKRVKGTVTLPKDRGPKELVVHLRLPGGAKVISVTAGGKLAGESARWADPRGTIAFEAAVE